jgi:hypothetical protein
VKEVKKLGGGGCPPHSFLSKCVRCDNGEDRRRRKIRKNWVWKEKRHRDNLRVSSYKNAVVDLIKVN